MKFVVEVLQHNAFPIEADDLSWAASFAKSLLMKDETLRAIKPYDTWVRDENIRQSGGNPDTRPPRTKRTKGMPNEQPPETPAV